MKLTTTALAGYLSKADAATYSSISQRSLDLARARGDLPFIRFSTRKILFAKSDLDRWLGMMRVDVAEGRP